MSDLISRQVAVNELIAMREHLSGMSIIGMEAYNMAIECLQEPERPKGKWMFESETEMFQCPKCKGMAVRNDYPFCHWCGAEMEAGE